MTEEYTGKLICPDCKAEGKISSDAVIYYLCYECSDKETALVDGSSTI